MHAATKLVVLTFFIPLFAGCTSTIITRTEPPDLPEQMRDARVRYQKYVASLPNPIEQVPASPQTVAESSTTDVAAGDELWDVSNPQYVISGFNEQEDGDELMDRLEELNGSVKGIGRMVNTDDVKIKIEPRKPTKILDPEEWRLKGRIKGPLRSLGLPPNGKLKIETSLRKTTMRYTMPLNEVQRLWRVLNPMSYVPTAPAMAVSPWEISSGSTARPGAASER